MHEGYKDSSGTERPTGEQGRPPAEQRSGRSVKPECLEVAGAVVSGGVIEMLTDQHFN